MVQESTPPSPSTATNGAMGDDEEGVGVGVGVGVEENYNGTTDRYV